MKADGFQGRRLRRSDQSEYAVYVLIAFPILLATVLVGRVLRIFSRPGASTLNTVRPAKSVFGETLELADTMLPWAFGGR